MDKEQQLPTNRTTCSKMGLLIAASLVLCMLFSAVAMVMSILTYNNQSWTENVIVVEDDPIWERETLSELEKLLERDGLMSFSKNRLNQTYSQPDVSMEPARVQREDREALFDDMCNSTKSGNYSDSLPLAHIVPNSEEGLQVSAIGGEDGYHRDPYVVITQHWKCGSHKKNNPFGIISGGMVFNRSSGYLILPKDGVYYVYSHVQFKLQESDKTYETAARMAACIPGEECKMNAYRYSKLTESGGTVTQHNYRRYPGEGEHGLYQGGLFHFPAGTRIMILAKDPKYKLPKREKDWPDKLFTSVTKQKSYMGAYLVEEMDYVF